MRARLGDALISLGALAVLAVTLISIDTRVREHIVRMASGTSVGDAEATAGDLASLVLAAVRDQTLAHAPLAIFALAATVLVLCMLRT
jgi:hypothetical protein